MEVLHVAFLFSVVLYLYVVWPEPASAARGVIFVSS